MSLTHQAVLGVKWNSLATVAKAGVHVVSLAVLARLLDPGDFGLMSMAVVITGFAQAFADFGLSNAIIHRQDATREQLSSLYWVNLAIGASIFALIWLVVPLAVGYYQEPRLVPVLRWSAGAFLIVPLGQQFQSLLRRELRFRTLSLIQSAESVTYALAAVGLALGGFGVMSLVWGTLLRSVVGAGLLLGVASRSHWLPAFRFRRNNLSSFVQFGLFQMGERSLNYLATNLDYLIIGRFLGSEPLGYYTLAYNLMRTPLNYINPVIVSVAFPAFARVQSRNDILRAGYAKILHYLSAVSFPILAGIVIVSPLLVPLVYGEQWLPAVPVIQIFGLLGALKSLGNPIGSLLMAKGRADLGFWLNVVAIIGYGISNLLGVRWGISGVAASSLIFTCLVLQPAGFYLRWLTIRMTVREFWQAIKHPTVATLAMFAFLVPMYHVLMLANHEIAALVLLVSVGVTTYAVMIRLLDRPLLHEVWSYLKPTHLPEV